VAKVSRTNERNVAVTLLKSKKAPNIIFQNPGLYKNADVGTNWEYPLTKYLNMPNPYVSGNKKWSDLFIAPWLNVMRSMDGNFYYIPIDSIPIGIIYNKSLFAKAGIDKAPETYVEFNADLDKLHAIGVIPYMPIFHWYDLFIQGSLLAGKLDTLDVLHKDGVLDAEEIARGYAKGLFSIKDPEYTDYFKLIKEKTRYYPDGWQQVDALSAFLKGQIGMIEAVGVHMRTINDDKTKNFDVATFPFPRVTTASSKYATSGIIRGNAGYSTLWQITDSTPAADVPTAVDFLMYITAPENNAKLVNGLSATCPAAIGAESVPLFKPLNDIAAKDMASGFKDWHACAVENAFDAQLTDAYTNLYNSYLLGKISATDIQNQFDDAVKNAIQQMDKNVKWDKSKW
jgi:ABC-type glycerol-3-phosphate transport system substrate-binding protein